MAELSFSLPCMKRGVFVKTWRKRWVCFDGHTRTASFWTTEQEMRDGRSPRSQHIILRAAEIEGRERANGMALYYENSKATFIAFNSAAEKQQAHAVFNTISADSMATRQAAQGAGGDGSGSSRTDFNSMMHGDAVTLEDHVEKRGEEEKSAALYIWEWWKDLLRGQRLRVVAVRASAKMRHAALERMHAVRPLVLKLISATIPASQLRKGATASKTSGKAKVMVILSVINQPVPDQTASGKQIFVTELGPYPVVVVDLPQVPEEEDNRSGGGDGGRARRASGARPQPKKAWQVLVDEQVCVPGIAQYGAVLHLTLLERSNKNAFLGQACIKLGQKQRDQATGHLTFGAAVPFLWQNGSAPVVPGSDKPGYGAQCVPRSHALGPLQYHPRRRPRSEGLVLFNVGAKDAWKDNAEDINPHGTFMEQRAALRRNHTANGVVELEVKKRDDVYSFSGFLQYRSSTRTERYHEPAAQRRLSFHQGGGAASKGVGGIAGGIVDGLVGAGNKTLGLLADGTQAATDMALNVTKAVTKVATDTVTSTVDMLTAGKTSGKSAPWQRVWVNITADRLSLYHPPYERFGSPFRTISALNCFETGNKTNNGAKQLLKDKFTDTELLVREKFFEDQSCRLKPRRMKPGYCDVLYHEFRVDADLGTAREAGEGREMWRRLLYALAVPNGNIDPKSGYGFAQGMPQTVQLSVVLPQRGTEPGGVHQFASDELALEATLGRFTVSSATEGSVIEAGQMAEQLMALEHDPSRAAARPVTLELRWCHEVLRSRLRVPSYSEFKARGMPRFVEPRAKVHHTVLLNIKGADNKVEASVRVHLDDLDHNGGRAMRRTYAARDAAGHSAGTVELAIQFGDFQPKQKILDGHYWVMQAREEAAATAAAAPADEEEDEEEGTDADADESKRQ